MQREEALQLGDRRGVVVDAQVEVAVVVAAAPTARNLLCTATPISPMAVSQPTIENVATSGGIGTPPVTREL